MSTAIGRAGRGKVPGPDSGIEIRKSVCTICDPATQCGLDVYVQDGRIIKVEGSKENPHNGGTLCSKGAATRQYVYHENRLQTPLRRVGPRGGGRFEAIGWDDALDEIAQGLNTVRERYGPESVAFFAGYTKYFRPFLHRLATVFGSPNYMTESSTCFRAMAMAQELTWGTLASPDMANAACLLIWSNNPFHTNTSTARRILDAKERGLKIIAVDPRVTPTTQHADLHLQLRPGTDGALALAMAQVIIEEGLYDEAFVGRWTEGFDEYRAYAREFPPERAEGMTGVPADLIRQAARMYANAKPAAIQPSASPVVHQTNGVQNYRAVFALAGLTGNFDVRGGNLAQPASYLYVSGGFESREHEFCHARSDDDMPHRVGADVHPVWCEMVDEAQAMRLPFQIASGHPYPIKAVVGVGMNHRMWPDPTFLLEQLGTLDLFVDIDLFHTDTAAWADIVLPACTSLERGELRAYPQRWVAFSEPVIEPLYDSRSDVDILLSLAERLDLDDPLLHGGYEACVDWMLAPSGMTVAEIRSHPGGMPVPHPLPPKERKYESGGFATPSGRLEFVSQRLGKYTESHGYDALPTYRPPRHSPDGSPDLAAEYPLVLNTGSRLPMFIHGRTFRLPWTRSLRPEPAADLNPADAVPLGIAQGDDIRLSTPKGAIQVKANLTEAAQPGVVHMYHAYPEADVNALIEPDYVDPISGFPGFKGLLCKVERA